MDPLAIALIVIGLLVAIVGGIMLLIAEFREGLMWGLAYLFVPLAGLVFVVVHWDTAKRGFLLNLLGACVVIGGLFASPTIRKSVAENMPVNLPMLEKEKPADLTSKIDQMRTQIETWEAQFQQQGAALTQEYKALDARRAALKPDDDAGVTAYNAEAATYQQANAGLKQLRQQIDTAQQELSILLDERAEECRAAQSRGGQRTDREARPRVTRRAAARRWTGRDLHHFTLRVVHQGQAILRA
jgi:hypothetical protein